MKINHQINKLLNINKNKINNKILMKNKMIVKYNKILMKNKMIIKYKII